MRRGIFLKLMKTFIFLLSLTLVIFTQIGCQKEEPVTRQQVLSEGFSLMDQGRWDEAISYFQDVLDHDPHYHVKLALASAYAGRAGIKIEQIYQFSVVKEVPVPKIEMKGLALDKQTSATLENLAKYLEHWNKIPDVQGKSRADILSALKTLENENEPGVRLYSAVLRIVNVKSTISQGVENFNLRLQSKKKICTQDLKPYVNWSGKVFESLILLTSDLELAFPEQKKNYEEIRVKIDDVVNQVSNLSWPVSNQCY
ncbi:hypothetical protein AZI86_00765 [Bdellovibrio bacteriovorus]|uniref:Uncharacterized protein n=2 Tax=Bdellovibrio bacteriovorus TaxID=959 RepID=A0A150WMF1_BDEBC|nr:hypothetical protein AZI86_00765 [Bdellovibrio bacteriovorus]